MSETENPNRKTPVVDAEFDETDFDSELPPEAPPAPPPRRGVAAAVAWLALLAAIAALCGVAYLYLALSAGQDSAGNVIAGVDEIRQDTEARLEAADAAATRLGEELAALKARGDEDAGAIGDLEDAIEAFSDKADTLDSLSPRLASLERALSNLQGISADARNHFLLAEAEYYLQIANAQLQLAGNGELADLALEQADDRLVQLGDPALTDVRRAIADERAALAVMEKPDLAGATMTLGSLAQVVESLPLRDAGESAAEPAGDTMASAEEGPLRRAWGSVKEAFAGVFDYTPPADPDRPLLAPGADSLLRANLALQLQAARLALLRGEQELFEHSLADADDWLERYFDTESAPVTSARDTLREISEGYRRSAAPDISGSLRLLRQHLALADDAP